MEQIYTTLISPEVLHMHIDNPDWVVLDCRFSLADTGRGERDYLESHIPGAVYAHLDRDLSGQVIKGKTGRHPLPSVESILEVFSKFGIDENVQVVSYDDACGALAAARPWWMLRWLGHEAAAVLDGGWQAWLKAGLPVRSGVESNQPREFRGEPKMDKLVTAEEVDRMRQDSSRLVIDARARERYRGDVEPIDPVAGHITGAVNAPYSNDLSPQGTFRRVDELRRYYRRVLGDIPAERCAVYCGSGVTSIHNILAMVYAGIGEPKLYAGSWSEWITDPERTVSTGPSPA